ncbi:MAG: putative enzyme related to lactoylglutathione lyase [Bacteroidia bacterium]|jgi:predicted enzyme related to lactoylglutathione lyase
MPDSKMYMFGTLNERGSAGCLVNGKESNPSADGTIVYFSCEDVATEASRVEAAGGEVIFPKTDIGEFGFYAQILNTEGNCIGLHSNS